MKANPSKSSQKQKESDDSETGKSGSLGDYKVFIVIAVVLLGGVVAGGIFLLVRLKK
jgi:hypothetical protein